MSETSSSTRFIGQVKWFNNKKGFGFVTVQGDSQYAGKEIYVHYSNIVVGDSQQYKYLVDGEYVEFDLSASTDSSHEYQATSVTGIYRGTLMCQVRQLTVRPVRHDNAEGTQQQSAATITTSSEPRKKVNGKKRFVTDADGFVEKQKVSRK